MPFQLPTLLVSPLTLSKQVVWLVPASRPRVLLHLCLTSHMPSLSAIVLEPSSPDLDLYLTGLPENWQNGATQDLSNSVLSYCYQPTGSQV